MRDPDPMARNDGAAAARAEVFDALDKEMEYADYCTAESGHKVRRVPRNQVAKRMAQRAALNDADMMQAAIEADDGDLDADGDAGEAKRGRKRLRGTKVAFEDVVLKSMPVDNNVENVNRDADESENREDDEIVIDQIERQDMLQEMATLGINPSTEVDDSADDMEEGDEEGDFDDDDENKEDEKETKPKRSSGYKVTTGGLIKPTKSTKRFMHRLREFTSRRLAQKHGEAIGAHIMGMSETAVQKLREVAKSAPGAPQVYSSLGMVFDDMLAVVERGYEEQGEAETKESSRLNHLRRRLELTQKSYASYHVASVLCKRDFVLWERSGDAAVKGAQVYSEIIECMAKNPPASWDTGKESASTGDTPAGKGFDPNAGPEKWKSERKLWLERALFAFQSADNLRPPGVDIPCKLTQVHLSLGNLIEALSILTDLRNTAVGNAHGGDNASKRELGRSEMEGSYPCWLLYADLMMRLGNECRQWNEGTSKVEHHMFKRWLRKHSKTFDWKERRIQALCLALEAAAGSESCADIIKWMRKRAEKCDDINEKEEAGDDNVDEDAAHDGAKEAQENAPDKDESCKSAHDEERERLANVNKVELQKFDRMTKEMNLVPGSIIFKERTAARKALVIRHRSSILNMAMRHCEKEQESIQNKEHSTDLSEGKASPKPLPLRGSRATVYDIAALLLRQCIQLKLFRGGLLAVQSVLDYSKTRVSRYERSIELQKENQRYADKGVTQRLLGPGFKYDQVNFESDESDEAYISDDEDLDQEDVLQLLKSGRLPVGIRAMHVICLYGAGGQDYMAIRYLDQVISNELDSLDEEEISPDVSNTDEKNEASEDWELYAPINKEYVLSFVADLAATDNAKGQPQLHSLLSILKHHFLTHVMMNQGLDFDEVLSSPKKLEKAHAIKMLLSTLKLMIDCARMDVALLDGLEKTEASTVNHAVTEAVEVLKIMSRFEYILWNPSLEQWSLPQSSMYMVSILSGAISVLVQGASLVVQDNIFTGFTKARQLISRICQAESTASEPPSFSNSGTWRSFPLPHAWQTSFHEKISLRAYNLCMAGCVSSFSGWEPNEFNLDQLWKSDTNFFGVHLEGPCVAGFLPATAAAAVAEQWDYMSQILPDLEHLPFEAYLDNRKALKWYQNVRKNMQKQNMDSSKISRYGEELGIRALLSFSTLCLMLAEESEGDKKDEFVKLSMSVLLPMTQFSIDKQVWQSTIGTLVMSAGNEIKIGFYLDENCHWSGPTKTKQGQGQSANNKIQRKPSKVSRPIRKRRHTSVAKVPTAVLLKEWRKDDVHPRRKFASEDAQCAMKKLDDAMKNLRKSRTLNSLEQASIDVSVALIALLTYDECENPFLCFQQASMFAAMGSKRGSNDEPFKRFLPLKNLCSPLEALNVLCRADCLRAVHFFDEAQFLCSWVASVCRAHRDNLVNELSWNSRWQVIGVLTYTVSATLDETSELLLLDDPDAGALPEWDKLAIKEIDCGKSDALFLLRLNPIEKTDGIAPSNTEGPVAESPMPNHGEDPQAEDPQAEDPQAEIPAISDQNQNYSQEIVAQSETPLLSHQNTAARYNQYLSTGGYGLGPSVEAQFIYQSHIIQAMDAHAPMLEEVDIEIEDAATDDEDKNNPFASVEVVGI